MIYRGMEVSLMIKDKVREFEPEATSMSRQEFIDYAIKISTLPRIFPDWTSEDYNQLYGYHWDHVQAILAEAKE